MIIKKRTLSAVLSCVLVLVIAVVIGAGLSGHEAVTVSGTVNDWGLSFRTENGIPSGNASAEELKKYSARYLGDTSQKKIWLTFDAGYENGFTESILDTLKKHNVRAVFFLVGNYVSTSPDIVKRMIKEGHTVGNHTMTHPDMSSISDMESFKKEIEGLETLYKETTGKELTKLYRPPQGKFSTENLKMAQKLGYTTVFWSLAYADWNNDSQPTREQAFDKLLPRIHDGAVVLLHSTSKTNCEILDELLSKWEDMGYSFGSPEELVMKQ